MYKNLSLLFIILFLTSIFISGCETVKGVGKDIQSTGELMNKAIAKK